MALQRDPIGQQSIYLVDFLNEPSDPHPNMEDMQDALLAQMAERCEPYNAANPHVPWQSVSDLMRLYQFLDDKAETERPHKTIIQWLEPEWVTQEKEAKAKADQEKAEKEAEQEGPK